MKPDGVTDTNRPQGAAQVPADLDLGVVLDRIAEHIVIQDDQMRVIWANQAAGTSVGTEPEALLGRRCYEVWQERDEPCVGCPVLKSINSGETAQAEVRGADGRHWFIKGYPLRDPDGAISGAIEITMDITERKKAEEALWESRQRYSNLFQYSSDAIFVHDPDGRIIDVNQKALDLTGYTRSEILAMRISDLHPPQALDRSRLAFEDVSRERFVTFEIDFLKKDGTLFHSEVSASLFDIQGSRMIQGIVRDITERKRAEQALRRSEEQHRSLVENINEIIFTLDTKGRFTYISPVLDKILGYSTGDVIGKPFNCFVHPDDAPGLLVTLEKGLDGTQKTDELRVLHKDGTVRFVRISCRPSTDGDRLVGLTGIMADITETRMAKAVLRESEEMYETLVRTTTDGVTVSDLQGRITQVSARALQLHGYDKPDELIGRSSFDLIAPHDHRRALQGLKATLKKGFLRREEYTLIRKDGTQFVGELDAAVIRDAGGSPKGFIATTRDITERKRSDQALRRSEQRFRDIAENSSEWIWEVDAQGIYTYSSPVVKKILGYEVEEILGRHFYELYPAEEAEREKEAVFNVFQKKRPFREYVHTNLRKDGTRIWLATSGVPILSDTGELLGYRGADADITEGKHASKSVAVRSDRFQHSHGGEKESEGAGTS
jgi:PAS domain S-box-containing protein